MVVANGRNAATPVLGMMSRTQRTRVELCSVALLVLVAARSWSACAVGYTNYASYAAAVGLYDTNTSAYVVGGGPSEDRDADGLANEAEYLGWPGTRNGALAGYSSAVGQGLTGCGPDPFHADTDTDGLSDLGEALAGSNPRASDTDGDSLPDAWEVHVGLDPCSDGALTKDASANPDNLPTADPDGDGLTNAEEWRGPNGVVPALQAATNGLVRAPVFGVDDYTLPLHADSDGDRLLDSFEYQAGFGLDPSDATDDADGDPDADGLTTYREQCLHPLLSACWAGVLPLTNAAAPVYAGPPALDGGFPRATLDRSGYLNRVGMNDPAADQWPASPGVVRWGHPVVRSTGNVSYPTAPPAGYAAFADPLSARQRWSNPAVADSDSDLLPDGWEVEHALNPLSGVLTPAGAINPGGPLGDPDGDWLTNLEEYRGEDGFRIDRVTGSGDETIPWTAPVVGRRFGSPFGMAIGQYAPSNAAHRLFQPPSAFLTASGMTFVAAYSVTNYPGLFNVESWAVSGRYEPVPGVPAPPALGDAAAMVAGAFQPFAGSEGDVRVVDFDGVAGYAPGVDGLFLDRDTDGIFSAGDAALGSVAMATGLVGQALAAAGLTLFPMGGADTDDDGIPDAVEVTAGTPCNPVCSTAPFVRRAAYITGINGLAVNLVDPDEAGRRNFGRDWTIECWVYLREAGTNTYSGVLVHGRVQVEHIKRTGFELGVTNSRPYVAFQTTGGYRYRHSNPAPMPMNQWVHLAGVFESRLNSMSLLLNGRLMQSEQGLEDSSSIFALIPGIRCTGALQMAVCTGPVPFAGNLWLDEVRVWGVARTSAEIARDAYRLVNPFQAAPVTWPSPASPTNMANALFAYFPFDDGGRTAEDFTKRASVTLAGYVFPADSNVVAAPQFEYAYGDTAYALRSDAVEGAGRAFVFDATRAAPVSGVIDSERGAFDADADGLPDGWESRHELNSFKARTPGHAAGQSLDAAWGTEEGPGPDAERDLELPTGDGLTNRMEYASHTDPRRNDTDDDTRPDAAEDYDGDGLENGFDAAAGARPDRVDTDDDGLRDEEEQAAGTDPANAVSPARERWLAFDGYAGSALWVPEQGQWARLPSWTVEAWVRPAGIEFLQDGQGATVVRRAVQRTGNGLLASTFELRVARFGTNLTVEGGYVAVDENMLGTRYFVKGDPVANGAAVVAANGDARDLAPDEGWVPIAASFSTLDGVLRMYVNGACVAQTNTPLARPPISGDWVEGPHFLIGEDFRGFIGDVRVWSEVRSDADILAGLTTPPTGSESGLAARIHMDDGGGNTTRVLPGVRAWLADPGALAATNHGDRYLVASGAGGVFAGREGTVAAFVQQGGTRAWTYAVPEDGARLMERASGSTLQFVAATTNWVSAPAAASVIRAVRYGSEPVSPVEGDTWWTGSNVAVRQGGVTFVRPWAERVFIEESLAVVNGAAVDEDLVWLPGRGDYYRRRAAGPTMPDTPGWVRWGPTVDQLADAQHRVAGVAATTNAIPSGALVDGAGYVISNRASLATAWGGGLRDWAPLHDGTRVVLSPTETVCDWSTASSSLVTVARAADADNVFVNVADSDIALLGDGAAWRHWGPSPRLEVAMGAPEATEVAMRRGGVDLQTRAEVTLLPDRDSDGDGLADAWETSGGLDADDAAGANGAEGDPDGDGSRNAAEQAAGTHPGLADTDGDGLRDGDEAIADTSPTDAADRFRIAAVEAGADEGHPIVFHWDTKTGRLYTVSASTSSMSGWTSICERLGTGSGGSYTSAAPATGATYFRLGVQLQE